MRKKGVGRLGLYRIAYEQWRERHTVCGPSGKRGVGGKRRGTREVGNDLEKYKRQPGRMCWRVAARVSRERERERAG